MSDIGPSSVTIEEAVAKMIGFDVLPEQTLLEDAIAQLANLTKEDYFNAQEDNLESSIIHRFGEELQYWQQLLLQAKTLLEDLQESIDKPDALLHIVPSDTCRTRITTQSVYAWAQKRHDIQIPEWQEYRGAAQKPYQKLDKVLLEGEHIFEAIIRLIDELLLRDWPAWKGNTPDLTPPKKRTYFVNDRPNVNAISSTISQKLITPLKDPEGPDHIGTITTHVKRAIKTLTTENPDKRFFTKKQLPAAYRTLIGLLRLLDNNYKPPPESAVRDHADSELQLLRFTNSLISTSGLIPNDELIDCLMRALRKADEEKC